MMGSSAAPGVRELLWRLGRAPKPALWLLLLSVPANLLGLAGSLFVIQVLNRYVSHGISGTLLTLAAGTVLALLAEHSLRRLRFGLADQVSGEEEGPLAERLFVRFLGAPLAWMGSRPPGESEAVLGGVARAAPAFGPGALAALADLPFSLLFLGVLVLLSPLLAGIAGLFCLGLLLTLGWRQRRQLELSGPLAAMLQDQATLLATAGAAAETVRHYRAATALHARWQRAALAGARLQRLVAWHQVAGDSAARMLQGLMSVAVVGVGATQVVGGTLDVGALMGANLIAARAVAPLLRLVSQGEALGSGARALSSARRALAAVPVERSGGRTLPEWRGAVTLRGVGIAFPGRDGAVLSGVSVSVPAGGVLGVTGGNGSGKSSLLRVVAGLMEPGTGQILADGVDLCQISLEWWRSRIAYLPQEPVFLDASLGDNLRLACPEAEDGVLWDCLARVGLERLTDIYPAGLDLRLRDGGRLLSPGVRRRLALARALLVQGPLALLDEPSEGLDREGIRLVYKVLADLAREGRTLIIASHDPVILRGATQILHLEGGRARPESAQPESPGEAAA